MKYNYYLFLRSIFLHPSNISKTLYETNHLFIKFNTKSVHLFMFQKCRYVLIYKSINKGNFTLVINIKATFGANNKGPNLIEVLKEHIQRGQRRSQSHLFHSSTKFFIPEKNKHTKSRQARECIAIHVAMKDNQPKKESLNPFTLPFLNTFFYINANCKECKKAGLVYKHTTQVTSSHKFCCSNFFVGQNAKAKEVSLQIIGFTRI